MLVFFWTIQLISSTFRLKNWVRCPPLSFMNRFLPNFRFLFFQFWIKDAVGRSIDAVRDLEEPEFSARDRNTQVFFMIGTTKYSAMRGGAKFFKMMKIKIFVKHFSKANVLKNFYFDFYLCVIKLKAVSFIPPTPIKTSKKSCITFRGVGSILQCRNILISDFTFLTHSNYFVALGIYILET